MLAVRSLYRTRCLHPGLECPESGDDDLIAGKDGLRYLIKEDISASASARGIPVFLLASLMIPALLLLMI